MMEMKVLITMTVVMVTYVIVGGIVFQKIEGSDTSELLSEILVHVGVSNNGNLNWSPC